MGTRPSASLTAAYGSREGKPLLLFHGYPSSRLEASGVDELARRRGIRVISLDRPGNGLSTMQPNRTIMDWTVDIRAFAEGMKLDRFAIIGGSGGGPYALACAHALPREMVAGVGLCQRTTVGGWRASHVAGAEGDVLDGHEHARGIERRHACSRSHCYENRGSQARPEETR
uniref:AB hydrolase-1 domain-containing protein n=1 Tax=Bionectria ochroleuca TaxID=29856 RepID=A0A8H7NIA3_BIOOC